MTLECGAPSVNVLDRIQGIILACAIVLPHSAAWRAQDDPAAMNLAEIGDVHIDKAKKEIKIEARLSIRQGILEYLLVSERGKAYESVFKVRESLPSELNFALLLIGSKPLRFDRFMNLRNRENGLSSLLKSHTESLLELEFYSNGKRISLDDLIRDRESAQTQMIWVHTGGVFVEDNRYAGDFELSHIGIWPDVTAVINLFSDLRNPYRGNYGLEINEKGMASIADMDFEIVIRRKSDVE